MTQMKQFLLSAQAPQLPSPITSENDGSGGVRGLAPPAALARRQDAHQQQQEQEQQQDDCDGNPLGSTDWRLLWSGESSGVVAPQGSSTSISTATPNLNPDSAPITPPESSHNCSDHDPRLSNVFVCMMPQWMADADLVKLFSPFGSIESAKVMLNIHTGKSRGIAFVKFHSARDAQQAIAALDGHVIGDGHRIGARIANAKAAYQPGPPTNKIFVRNVPEAITHERLHQYYAQFGGIVDVSILHDTASNRKVDGGGRGGADGIAANHHGKKIAFVTFDSVENAAKAADATHTATPFVECGAVPLLVKVAEASSRRLERISRRDTTSGGGPTTIPSTPVQFLAQPSKQQQQHAVAQSSSVPIHVAMEAPRGGAMNFQPQQQQQPQHVVSSVGPLIIPQQPPSSWQDPSYLYAPQRVDASTMPSAPSGLQSPSSGGRWVQIAPYPQPHPQLVQQQQGLPVQMNNALPQFLVSQHHLPNSTQQQQQPTMMPHQHSNTNTPAAAIQPPPPRGGMLSQLNGFMQQQQQQQSSPYALSSIQIPMNHPQQMANTANMISSSVPFPTAVSGGGPYCYGALQQQQQLQHIDTAQPFQLQQQQALPISLMQGDGSGGHRVVFGAGMMTYGQPQPSTTQQAVYRAMPSPSSSLQASQNLARTTPVYFFNQ